MVDIPFPKSSQPGQAPGEGLGRLLNWYYETDEPVRLWRKCPGLVVFADPGIAGPRGAIDVNGTLYAARNNTAFTITNTGLSTQLSGALSGTDTVTWARNNATPSQVVAVSENGAFQVDLSHSPQVFPYPDTSLPQPTSVAFLDGYFLFTIGDGRIFASGINNIWVDDTDHVQNALSFTDADMSGGLLLGTTWAEQFFAWGKKAITVYTNQALTPFPLGRTTIVNAGLIGKNAVTGYEEGWTGSQYFVSNDSTVRRLDGVAPTKVSNRDVERALEAINPDHDDIMLSCYSVGGRQVVVVRTPNACWELNTESGVWNERISAAPADYVAPVTTWRATRGILFAGDWLVGDTLSTKTLKISASTFDEVGTSFSPGRLESGPLKNYPSRLRVPRAFFDFTTGQAPIVGTSDATNPSVLISTSVDGGGTWSEPQQVMSIGRQGAFQQLVRINRIGRIATQHGIRFRLDTSSPVYATFRGGRCDVLELAPP